ncbi:molybdopterin molybdotransferase MoeA [Microbacterium sp. P04]|uniref:molybdopterin molybdotransferase MoeA n=1 Tax=Microbacterium sp. P04 TaxID=3366947 RepID=UPI00374548DD
MTRDERALATPWTRARALAHAAGTAAALAPEHVALLDASGRWLAADVVAPEPLPHFDSSAMDGWAVSGTGPWRLDMSSDDRMLAPPLAPGFARRVVTGQQIPPGATAVVRSERASEDGGGEHGRLRLHPGTPDSEAAEGKHVRRAGAEAHRGETLVAAGVQLNPAQVALAAACGLDAVRVAASPPVALVLTGDEVVVSGRPRPGEVRDSFGPTLPPLLRMLGARPTITSRLGDDLGAIEEHLVGPEPLVCTTGGTGGSEVDHVRRALDDVGARLIIDGLAVRPGAPTVLAELPDGRFVLALPGNPLAAMVGLLLVGAPLLVGLAGRVLEPLPTVPVDLAADRRHSGRAGGADIVPFTAGPEGARPTGWTGAAMLRGLAAADGLLVLESAGTTEASVLPLPWRTELIPPHR